MSNESGASHSASESGPQDDIEDQPSAGLRLHCDLAASLPFESKLLLDHFQQVASYLRIDQVDLDLVLIEDDRMARMHEEFSGVPGTTDVLTFDFLDEDDFEESDPIQVEGEIYACVDEAKRQSERRGHTLELELLLYLTHGLLHLLGYDDHDPEEHRIMHEKEDEILNAIGVGAVFHRDFIMTDSETSTEVNEDPGAILP